MNNKKFILKISLLAIFVSLSFFSISNVEALSTGEIMAKIVEIQQKIVQLQEQLQQILGQESGKQIAGESEAKKLAEDIKDLLLNNAEYAFLEEKLKRLAGMSLNQEEKTEVADILGFLGDRRKVWFDLQIPVIDYGGHLFSDGEAQVIYNVFSTFPKSFWGPLVLIGKENETNIITGQDILFIGLDLTASYGTSRLVHEIGHLIENKKPEAVEKFRILWGYSDIDNFDDFAYSHGAMPDWPADWIKSKNYEDFAETHAIYGEDSAALVEQAISIATDEKNFNLLGKVLVFVDLYSFGTDQTIFFKKTGVITTEKYNVPISRNSKGDIISVNNIVVPTIQIASPTCVDSDGGKNYFIRGEININGIKYFDQCFERVFDANSKCVYLKEHFCSTTPSSIFGDTVEHPCLSGCKDGVCQPGARINFPGQGSQLNIGKVYNIQWLMEGFDKVNLRLYKKNGDAGDVLVKTISENITSHDNETYWESYYYHWTVPSDIIVGDNYAISIDKGLIPIVKTDYFSIISASPKSFVDLKAGSSDGPITISFGGELMLSWESSGVSFCSGSYRNLGSTIGNAWGIFLTTSGMRSSGVLINSSIFRIDCRSADGTVSVSDSLTINIAVPSIPANLHAENININSVTWKWNAVSGATSYKLAVDSPSGYHESFTITSPEKVVSGLNSNMLYSGRISACNSAGCSELSASVNATTLVAPSVDLKINGINDAATISYGETIKLSWVSSNINFCSGSFTGPITTASTAWGGTKNVSGDWYSEKLASGDYTFTISCQNSVGTVVIDSVVVKVTTPVTIIPSTPTNLRAEGIVTDSITWKWSSISGATSYKLAVDSPSGYHESFTITSPEKVVSGLNSNMLYSGRISACNSAGCSELSASVNATTLVAPSVDLKINGINDAITIPYGETIKLSWVSSNINFCSGSFTGPITTASTAWGGTKNVSGDWYSEKLASGDYTFTISCQNSVGTVVIDSVVIKVTMPVAIIPSVPTNLRAEGIVTDSITWKWNAVSGATSYKLAVDSPSGYHESFTVTSPEKVVSGLNSNMLYSGRISACNSAGCSELSASVNATTLAPACGNSGATCSSGEYCIQYTNADGSTASYWACSANSTDCIASNGNLYNSGSNPFSNYVCSNNKWYRCTGFGTNIGDLIENYCCFEWGWGDCQQNLNKIENKLADISRIASELMQKIQEWLNKK